MSKTEDLVILWTSGDREVALKMGFMYAHNSRLRQWWDSVTIIVWGPSALLLSQDGELQEKMQEMMEDGVRFEACHDCADRYGVTEDLMTLGVDVRYMGQPLTEYMKEGRKVLTI